MNFCNFAGKYRHDERYNLSIFEAEIFSTLKVEEKDSAESSAIINKSISCFITEDHSTDICDHEKLMPLKIKFKSYSLRPYPMKRKFQVYFSIF